MKRHIAALGSLLGAALLAAPAAAQTGSARGKVVDEKGEPVADVRILIEYQGGMPITLESKTNDKGEYTQVGLRPGNYKFTAAKEGYRPTFIIDRIGLGEPTRLPDIEIISAEAARQGVGDDEAAKAIAAFNQAIAQTRAGDFEAAKASFAQVLELRPEFPEVYYNLGYIHAQNKDWAGAEAQYLKALEIKPDYHEAKTALVAVYQNSGQDAKAAELMEEAAAAGSADPQLYFNKGVMALNAGDNEAAYEAFLKVVELKPDHAEAQYHLGTLALNLGRMDEAVERLEKYLSLSPTNQQNVATAQGLLQALKK